MSCHENEHCWDKFKSHHKDANCCWCHFDQRSHPRVDIPTPTNSQDREKAEKLADDLWKEGPRSHLNPKQVEKIAAFRAEARKEGPEGPTMSLFLHERLVKEAREEGKKLKQGSIWQNGYDKGYANAVEDAAKVCDLACDQYNQNFGRQNSFWQAAHDLAKAIRGLKADAKA